jgi:hypothetical protein
MHVIQFFGAEDELAGRVGRFLAEGLGAGGIAITIATETHRAAVTARMAADCDVAAAQTRGDLVLLDAAEMLRLFLIGDHPDPGGFRLIIGGLIRRAAAAGRPVRIYGEMVALLWEAGHVTAGIELEELWNELGRSLPFSLLCGYRAASVSGAGHAAALQEVCGLHAAVTGVPPALPAP